MDNYSFEGLDDGNLDVLTVTLHTAGTGDVYFIPAAARVTVPPQSTGATGGVRSLTFSITGIDLMLEGDDRMHTVFFEVWGAAEAPSGVVFTPEEPAGATIAALGRASRK